MTVFPAIDLMGGKVVRLRQGRAEDATVYSDDPASVARKWAAAGACWLHVVDLDGAFKGEPGNMDAIRAIVRAADIPVQLGGGMREERFLEAAFEAGVKRVVLGSRASETVAFVGAMVERFGGGAVAVGIDARDGWVAVKGWTEKTEWDALELAEAVSLAGAGAVIYTDIATDGMLQGPNFAAMRKMAQTVDVPVIASGGVSCADDVRRLAEIPGLHGVIVGKALYDGQVALADILPFQSP